MKIMTERRYTDMPYKMLEIGDVFIYKQEVYMVTNQKINSTNKAAVNLSDGSMEKITEDTMVRSVESELLIKG